VKYDATWWKNEMGECVEKVKKDTKEVIRMHEISNACGKWSNIIKNQLEAMKASGIKPDAKNMQDMGL